MALRLLALGLIAACGCATAQSVEGPESVLAAYISAVQSGDAEGVYALLDDETRATVTRAEVSELMTQNREELGDQLEVLQEAVEAGVESRAEVPLASDEQVVLHIEEGAWAIGGGVLDAPALQTPRDAVLAFRHALKRRSMQGVLRVLARAPRSELEAEIEQFLEDTEDSLDLETSIQGNIARVRTSSGRVVLLTREAGEWRVVDVE